MKPKKLCILCHQRPAVVPDRERMGRPIKRVCYACHRDRLRRDAEPIIRLADEVAERLKGVKP